MAWVATENFRNVDRLLSHDNPTATLRLKPLGQEARLTLRYQASEINRGLFERWEGAQIVFGILFFFVMLFGSREDEFVLLGVLLMLLLTAAQRFFITPELIALGRTIDFVPLDAVSPDRQKFWVTHTAYSGIEGVKWLLALALTGRMVLSRKRSGRSRDSRRQVNSVDKPDYRRVNG
jgi:hypothetical protein